MNALTSAKVSGDSSLWRTPLQSSISRNKSDRASSWVQLATISPSGRPTVRTLVFRGFYEPPAVPPFLKFVTDRRSEKVTHIQSSPFVEVCWYFPITREQWRISGKLSIIGKEVCINHTGVNLDMLEEERKLSWSKMSDAGRSSFAWPTPGEERGEDDSLFISALPPNEETKAEKRNEDVTKGGGSEQSSALFGFSSKEELKTAVDQAYNNFCLVLLEPENLEVLCLKYNPTQKRWKFQQKKEEQKEEKAVWSRVFVNP
eukprot:TRINITY_DN4320_c0_g1_i5.p1 TRINITY_DN4320_c0_g1~~TRINITY_DN4320_c0_g1_i5.p1  ORF type:complete len:259 (-),score=55.47 TRINITY_DN4320_c0_g1_i5:37-813(-)